jgi:hypothetical protein
MEMGKRNKKLRVHVIKIDKKHKSIDLVPHIISDFAKNLGSTIGYDTTNLNSLVSINASFFQAGTNLPVGVTIIDSEPLQIKKYKNWSSIIFTNDSVFIDEVDLKVNLSFNNSSIEIDRYNYRTDTNQIVAYTRHYTDVFPIINDKEIEGKYLEYLTDSKKISKTDKSETLLSRDEFVQSLRVLKSDSLDYNYIVAKPNSLQDNNIRIYKIKHVDLFPIKLQEGEILLETPYQMPLFNGDEVRFEYNTNLNMSEVNHVITTTPLILKNGKEFVNSKYEGATSRRFNYSHLARSAFGYNDKYYYLVAVEPNRGRKVKGATLKELSWIMETIGAKDAINLDGGGSTALIIDGKNLAIPYNYKYNRKVSTAISVKINDD